jgi:hypothetical protein
LGVLDDTHSLLSEFITVGIDEEGRRAIGDLPSGHGILGPLLTDWLTAHAVPRPRDATPAPP